MFARIVEFVPKPDRKEEFMKVMKNQVLPILKKQTGFLEILPFVHELKDEKMIMVSLWMEKTHLEHYEHEGFPKVHEMVKPYLKTPITFKVYALETSLCEHFVQALAA
jgi:quinol monooxygenase YgiN